MKNKNLLRERIFRNTNRKKEKLDIPEWGEGIYLIALSGRDRDEYLRQCNTENGRFRDPFDGQMYLMVLSLVDENEQHIFDEEDIEQLKEQDNQLLDRVTMAITKFNGFKSDSVEEAEKNFDGITSANSGSISQ